MEIISVLLGVTITAIGIVLFFYNQKWKKQEGYIESEFNPTVAEFLAVTLIVIGIVTIMLNL